MSDSANVLPLMQSFLSGKDDDEEPSKKKKTKHMDEDDVLSFVAQEIGQAVGHDGDELSKARTEALNYYEGRPWAGVSRSPAAAAW